MPVSTSAFVLMITVMEQNYVYRGNVKLIQY